MEASQAHFATTCGVFATYVQQGWRSDNHTIGHVSQVLNLLKDMVKQLEKEIESDEEIYGQLACWCETDDEQKTQSIADVAAKIGDLILV